MSSPPRSQSLAPSAGPLVRGTASPAPLIAGSAALALSVAIAMFAAVSASAAVDVLGVPVQLVTSEFWWLSLVGYILTPIVVIACYGWDVLSQRNGLRTNRDFVLHPGWTRVLLYIVAAGLVVGAWHVVNLSVPVSEWWGFA